MLTWEGSWPNSLVRRPPWLQACSVKNKENTFRRINPFNSKSIFLRYLICFPLNENHKVFRFRFVPLKILQCTYLKRIAELDNFTMFYYYSIRMILNKNKEFIQSKVVVCKKEYWDLKVKLLPLCLYSVGIPKIRLVKPKNLDWPAGNLHKM